MTPLTKLRTDCGMTQAQAAQALGVSRQLLGFYETCQRPVPADVKARLHSLYGASDRSPRSTVSSPTVLLRSNRETLDAVGSVELNVLDNVLELYVELLDALDFEPCALLSSPFDGVDSRTQKSEAEWAARRARSWLAVDAGCLDPIDVANRVAMVFQLPLGSDLSTACSGFFFKHPRAGLTIVVNSDVTLGRQHFSAAHELAHALFHSQAISGIVSPGAPNSRVDGRERFANQFAVEFLMPADAVISSVKAMPAWASRSPVEQRVLAIQREFGVSYASAAFRMRNLGLINDDDLEIVQKQSPSAVAQALGWGTSPLDSVPQQLDRLAGYPPCMQWLFRLAINDGAVTIGDVAETCNVSTEAVRRMIQPASSEHDGGAPDLDYERYGVG